MNELLDELHALQMKKLDIDIKILDEKDKNHGVPRAHKQRLLEQVLVRQTQEIGADIKRVKNRILQKGEPLVTLTDVLANLYAVEALFEVGYSNDAWDALSGVLDAIEKEYERVGK